MVEGKPPVEESKVSIFAPSRYKIGVDHDAWNRAYAEDIINCLGLRRDVVTEAAIDAVISIATQVVRDVLNTSTLLVMHGKRKKLEVRDVENAINLNGCMMSPTSSNSPSNVMFRLSDNLSRTIYPKDKFMVDLRAIMNVTPRRLPFKRRIRKHWLVIEGEQPRVPENPVISSMSSSGQDGGTTFQSASSDSVMDDGNRVARIGGKVEQAVSRPITTHSLSLEQQVFFRECVETVIGPNVEKRREVLHLLTSDPGLQSLVPRFAVLIFEGVRCNIVEQNLPILRNILSLVKSLIDNVNVNLDKCTVAAVVVPRLETIRRRILSLRTAPTSAPGDDEKVTKLVEKMLTRFARYRKMPGLKDVADFERAFPGFGNAVYRRLKALEERRGVNVTNVDRTPGESGNAQGIIQKRYPRLPQAPMRAPGVLKPAHAVIGRLGIPKNNRRNVNETTSVDPVPGSMSSSQLPQSLQQQNVRSSMTQAPGSLPPVVVESVFPRRPTTMVDPSRAHPAVTVEPLFPRRPGAPR
ncbi:unnamed protein product [Nippostrongylus brasiliensis]|uniref:Transcription initiation factor TFIID subunit 6 (inferred by orthology to a human protein) n=1 Tax=Nippostrongylus brasiliensis TaxID=27835 RepID=A0A0N4Y204_NIPBR|nr:unnamed protein product [Nippostrongylus brasiliensis]